MVKFAHYDSDKSAVRQNCLQRCGRGKKIVQTITRHSVQLLCAQRNCSRVNGKFQTVSGFAEEVS